MSQSPHASAAPARAAGTASAIGAATRHRPLKATDTVSNTQPLILAVEPDARTRSLLEVGLAEQGFAVVSASSAEEAEGYLHPELMLPSMILCEAELRGIDGFSLCGRIRADARTADLPFVLLSRTGDAAQRELAGGAGADQLFTKPLFLNDLVAMAHLMAGRSSTGGRYEADTESLPVPRLLRSLLSGVRSGRIDFHSDEAWITFREGQVVDAACADLRGEEALRRLMILARGNYVVTFGPTLARATMSFGVEELCGSAYARLQRWEKALDGSVPLESVLVVDPTKLKAISDLPEEVGALVLLFDGVRSVRDVVVESRVDEVLALEAVGRLANMGVLVQRGGDAQLAERGSRVRPLHPVSQAAERPGPEEGRPTTGESRVDSDRPAPSLFESTETLDQTILRQLSAFRIRPVADRMGTVPASPELTAFVGHLETPAPGDPRSPSGETPPAALRPLGGSGEERPPLESAAAAPPSDPGSERTPETAASRAPVHVVPPLVGALPDDSDDASDDPSESRAEEDSFAAELEKIVAPERPPDRRWLILGIIGTAAVAVLAGLAVVISTRPSTAKLTSAAAPGALGVAPAQVATDESGAAPPGSAPAEPGASTPAGLSASSAGAAAPATPPAGNAAASGVAAGQPSAKSDERKMVAADPGSAGGEPGSAEAFPAAPLVQPALHAEGAPGANKPRTALARGVRLYKSGRHREAISVLEGVTRENPRLVPAWVYLGLARFDARDSAGAERAAKRALAISPRNGRALMLLASIHLEAGESEKAREKLTRYLELYPNGQFASEARQLLKR